jgi:hypothetical protein
MVFISSDLQHRALLHYIEYPRFEDHLIFNVFTLEVSLVLLLRNAASMQLQRIRPPTAPRNAIIFFLSIQPFAINLTALLRRATNKPNGPQDNRHSYGMM